jgi:hypothetical protein
LARRLDEAGIGSARHDNALVRVDDLEAAAELCERFAHKAWPRVLNAFAPRVNPIMPIVRAANYGGSYWVLDQAEIATDFDVHVAVQAPQDLARSCAPRRPQPGSRGRSRLRRLPRCIRPWRPRW